MSKVLPPSALRTGNAVDCTESGVVSSPITSSMQIALSSLKNSSRGAASFSRGAQVICGAAVLFFPPVVFSQSAPATQSAIQQVEALKAREKTQASKPSKAEDGKVPELYAGESADMGSQTLLTEKPVIRLFEATADTSFTYTSNASLDTINPKDTGIWATTLSLAIAPEAWEIGAGKLSVRSGYRHTFWIYDVKKQVDTTNLNAGNFELSSFFVSGRYMFLENWSATFGVDHNRIMGGKASWRMGRMFEEGNWNEIFTEFNPNWALDRSFELTKKVSASLGYSGGYHFTCADGDKLSTPQKTERWNDHLDNALMLNVMYSPNEKWMFQPFARVAHALYTRTAEIKGHEHRRDLTRSLGVNVVWSPTERTSIRASISGEFRNSNDPSTTDYSKFDAATGVSFTFKF